MRGSEKSLLTAVRNAIRANTRIILKAEVVQVEHDEIAPAIVAHEYIAVMPGGWSPGPRHNSSGGIWDFVFNVDVTIIKRIAEVPHDRIREAYLTHLASLDDYVEMLIEEIDFNYTVMAAANTLIAAEWGATYPSDQGFMHPLVFAGTDKRPRIVNGNMFNAPARSPKNSVVGLGRTVFFTRARRIVIRR